MANAKKNKETKNIFTYPSNGIYPKTIKRFPPKSAGTKKSIAK